MTEPSKSASALSEGKDAAGRSSNAETEQAAAQEQNPTAIAPDPRKRGLKWDILDASLYLGIAAGVAIAMIIGSKYGVPDSSKRVFTKDQLKHFIGGRQAPMYLAILGEVYDVTKGHKHYGEGGGYAFFVAKDATRAFVTGKFKEDLNDDVEGLTPEQLASLVEWRAFYRKEYTFKGRVHGAFYDKKGAPTAKLREVEEGAQRAKTAEEELRAEQDKYIRCNVGWTEAEGGRVWCDEGMYPRKMFLQLPGGKPTTQCACFDSVGWSDHRQVYPDCRPDASLCKV